MCAQITRWGKGFSYSLLHHIKKNNLLIGLELPAEWSSLIVLQIRYPKRVRAHSLLSGVIQARMLWMQSSLHQAGQPCLICSFSHESHSCPQTALGPHACCFCSETFVMGETKPWARNERRFHPRFIQQQNGVDILLWFSFCFFLDNPWW